MLFYLLNWYENNGFTRILIRNPGMAFCYFRVVAEMD